VAPFALGIVATVFVFTFFGWDLAHHWYSGPPRRRHTEVGILQQMSVVCLWLALLLPSGVRWLRTRWSRSWPLIQSKIQGGSVSQRSDGRRRDYVLTVPYAYSVSGERFGGVYVEVFASESEAQSLLKSLQDWPPPVRYKPGDPSKSVMEPYRDAMLPAGACVPKSAR
jgi:hypothetical protein